jgi:uncharacterized 2Fe-2S/4Fe-4S cluster protein (DUF4445 family)
MNEFVNIELYPLGKIFRVPKGSGLQDILFQYGAEFPCGGRGLCTGCKMKLLSGRAEETPQDKSRISAAELSSGWRLGCQLRATTDLRIELGQWDAPVLTDDSHFEFTPAEGLGLAMDIGTTTIAAQLVDRQTAQVLGVSTALNAQAQHGADIMSRIEFAATPQGQAELQRLIREQTGEMVRELLALAQATSQSRSLCPVALVGNTVMHHLFCGLSVEPLSHYPFESATPGRQCFAARDLGWDIEANAQVQFLPCVGGFIGSDILAGVLATRLHQSESLEILLDLGTNGEMVVGNRERMLCASTAAGPAFEGARISMGMRAATGAISGVHIENGSLECRVLGQSEARGICGSGLVDAAAAGLELGLIRSNGRLTNGNSLSLKAPVSLSQWDIRELQMAKGAIAAGCQLLLRQWGAKTEDVSKVFLAGAFGNYINAASARRIGLLDFPADKIVPSGNTALLGAKLALFATDDQAADFKEILHRMEPVSLHEDPAFQQSYAEHMLFPVG